jgi:hypothetical protein
MTARTPFARMFASVIGGPKFFLKARPQRPTLTKDLVLIAVSVAGADRFLRPS